MSREPRLRVKYKNPQVLEMKNNTKYYFRDLKDFEEVGRFSDIFFREWVDAHPHVWGTLPPQFYEDFDRAIRGKFGDPPRVNF